MVDAVPNRKMAVNAASRVKIDDCLNKTLGPPSLLKENKGK